MVSFFIGEIIIDADFEVRSENVKRTSSMNKLHTFPYDRALEYL
jgi:hypothetical protein